MKDVSRPILLVTNRIESHPKGGRELLCRLNRDALRAVVGTRLRVFELDRRQARGPALLRALRGHLDGLTTTSIASVLDTVASLRVQDVVVDGSNLGALVHALKERFPTVRVVTFFHNVEAVFFAGSLRERPGLHALGVTTANYLAERQAVESSDELICLSERDSAELEKLYGRRATHIFPLSLEEEARAVSGPEVVPAPGHLLFVGGTFYANRTGIEWFVRNVMPRIGNQLYIVGKGFERYREELEQTRGVHVIGAVEHVGPWYRDALVVVAPIFGGSGMKTKVAEALQHGKRVIGTPEAFSGYEVIASEAGWVCSTPDEFVEAIAQAQRKLHVSFDPALRAVFDANYSFQAACDRWAGLLRHSPP